ncbi:MAG: hypothetical protein HAW67_04670 [Endozoicomonadaceae bacterium]|nr:hypothetical protein [Endozoicomonadaceae bacterium]
MAIQSIAQPKTQSRPFAAHFPFLIEIKMQIGDIQKTKQKIILAPNESLAGHYGIYSESHSSDNLDWQDNFEYAYDMNGDLAYQIKSCKILSKSDYSTLKKFFPVHGYIEEDLRDAGNYLKIKNQSKLNG